MASLLLSDCVVRFLQWSRDNLKPRTVTLYETYLNRFVAAAGQVDVRQVTPAMLAAWSRRHHPQTAVRRLLSWLRKDERSIDSNPLEGMRKAKQGRRRRVLAAAELVRLCRLADPVFRQLLIALRESIARPQEIRALTWDDLRIDGGLVADVAAIAGGRAYFHLTEGKGFSRRADDSEERVIPITPRFGRLLIRSRRRDGSLGGTIFRDSRGRPWTANAVRCRMRRLRAAAGLVADARGEKIVAYSLRHTSATRFIANGGKPYLLRVVMGHASFKTTERYLHVQPIDAVDELRRVFELKTHRK